MFWNWTRSFNANLMSLLERQRLSIQLCYILRHCSGESIGIFSLSYRTNQGRPLRPVFCKNAQSIFTTCYIFERSVKQISLEVVKSRDVNTFSVRSVESETGLKNRLNFSVCIYRKFLLLIDLFLEK